MTFRGGMHAGLRTKEVAKIEAKRELLQWKPNLLLMLGFVRENHLERVHDEFLEDILQVLDLLDNQEYMFSLYNVKKIEDFVQTFKVFEEVLEMPENWQPQEQSSVAYTVPCSKKWKKFMEFQRRERLEWPEAYTDTKTVKSEPSSKSTEVDRDGVGGGSLNPFERRQQSAEAAGSESAIATGQHWEPHYQRRGWQTGRGLRSRGGHSINRGRRLASSASSSSEMEIVGESRRRVQLTNQTASPNYNEEASANIGSFPAIPKKIKLVQYDDSPSPSVEAEPKKNAN